MEKKTYDFRKVSVEVDFDTFKDMDLAKPVANTIHRNCTDIGIDDKARELYHNGTVELSPKMAAMFLAIIMQSNLIASVKKALKEMLEPDINNE